MSTFHPSWYEGSARHCNARELRLVWLVRGTGALTGPARAPRAACGPPSAAGRSRCAGLSHGTGSHSVWCGRPRSPAAHRTLTGRYDTGAPRPRAVTADFGRGGRHSAEVQLAAAAAL